MALEIESVVSQCRELLKSGLRPFVDQKMRARYGANWQTRASGQIVTGTAHWDLQALLKTILDHWQTAFDTALPPTARSLVHELKDWRNHIAHEHRMTLDDVSRLVHTAARLLKTIGVPQAAEMETLRLQVIREELAIATPRSPVVLSNPLEPKSHGITQFKAETSADSEAPAWAECVEHIGDALKTRFTRKVRRCVFSADNAFGLCCLVSKQYPNQRYWYNLREPQLTSIRTSDTGFVAFACGTSEAIVLIPLADFESWLPTFNPKPLGDEDGWHIHIQQDCGNWWLIQKGRHNRVNVTKYFVRRT